MWSSSPHHHSFPCLVLPSSCLLVLSAHSSHSLWGVSSPMGASKQVNLGVGLAGSAAGCSGQPEVGFVQGALGLVLSRHVLPPTRKPPALYKIAFLFFPPYYHTVGEDAVYPTSFCSRWHRWRSHSTSTCLQVWLPSVDVLLCHLS